jgi:GntR family transcriptional regulator / MocR family aminotransferase
MSSWDLAVAFEPRSDQPLFLQIARAIADDVWRGRLKPGDRLPGSRTLARTLEVHRNTVLAAYGELVAEGWIRTRPAGGTYVSSDLPQARPRRFAPGAAPRAEMPGRLGFDLRGASEPILVPTLPRGTLSLAEGVPDLRLVPIAALARAYRRALRAPRRATLAYGDPRGHVRLRAALAAMLSALRGLAASADDVLVTRGSQMALDLVARVLLAPGDVVAVEALGYRPAWTALRNSGAKLVPIPVDESGMRVDALEALAASERVRMVYVTPHHQYPTTVTMAPGRRLQLLELARTRRIAILEDDYDNEFHYDGRPVLPLASADRAGVVIYVGTLSKLLAPGLRIGFLVAPQPMIARLAETRTYMDRQGDQAVECAVAELLEDGEVQRHARRARRLYRARRDLLARLLRERLGHAVRFEVPAGGMALWMGVVGGIDIDAWSARARERGIVFVPGRRFAFDGRPRPFTRLVFAGLDESELQQAVKRMADSLG